MTDVVTKADGPATEAVSTASGAIAILGLLLAGACGGNAVEGNAGSGGGSVSCVDGTVSGPADAALDLTGTSCSTESATCFTPDHCIYWTCTAGEWVYCQCGC